VRGSDLIGPPWEDGAANDNAVPAGRIERPRVQELAPEGAEFGNGPGLRSGWPPGRESARSMVAYRIRSFFPAALSRERFLGVTGSFKA